MNTSKFLAVAALAVVSAASSVAFADEADASQYVHQSEGNRTRAEVQAEAGKVSATRSFEPAGSRVAAAPQSRVERAAVAAEGVQAFRAGATSRGEAGATL
ncbi:MAG: DUF4148 domain-containing protein [Burkholderiaceae bacterium]